MKQYTDEEKDAVIDYFDLGFMRNRLKQSDSDMNQLMNSFGGAWALLGLQMSKLGIAIGESPVVTKGRELIFKWYKEDK